MTTALTSVRLIEMPQHLGGVGGYLLGLVDEKQRVGWGELTIELDLDAVQECTEALSQILLSKSPVNREGLWHALSVAIADWDDTPAVNYASLAAADMAVWDLAAQQLDIPTWVLMGGSTRSRLDIYMDCGNAFDENCMEKARALVQTGLRYFIFEADPAADVIAAMKQARRLVGEDCLVATRVVAPAADTEAAIELGKLLDKTQPLWIEGLLRDGKWSELGEVRKSIEAATSCGLTTIGWRRLHRALETKCADLLCVTPQQLGGPTACLRLLDVADLYGVKVSLHGGRSVVGTLAAAHVSFARSIAGPLRMTVSNLDDFIRIFPDLVQDGFILSPNEAGWGLGTDLAQMPVICEYRA